MDSNPIDTLSETLMDVPDIVFAFGEDGRYLFVNSAAAAFLDVDPIDVIGSHWHDRGCPDAVMCPLLDEAADVFADETARFFRFTCAAHRSVDYLDVSLTPLRCDGAGVVGVLAIGRNPMLMDREGL